MNTVSALKVAGQIGRAVLSDRVSYLIVFVTARCNLLCKHCFYTEEIQNASSKRELTLSEYGRIAEKLGPLTNLNFTGGEPFLRQDLPEIIRVFRKHTQVPFVGITTNGLLPDRTVQMVERVSRDGEAYHLKIGVSLDGFEDVHDGMRGKIGAFKEALRTIAGLKPLRARYPTLMVYVSTTVTKYNKATIRAFIDLVRKDLDVDAHYLGYVRGNTMAEDAKEVTLDEYRDATEYLSHRWNRNSPFYNLLNGLNTLMVSVNKETIDRNGYVLPCVAGEKMLTLSEEGMVKPCEVLEQISSSPHVMGNVREHDYDIHQILATPAAREIRRKILVNHCHCTFECANQASIVYKPRSLVTAARLYLGQKVRSRLGQ